LQQKHVTNLLKKLVCFLGKTNLCFMLLTPHCNLIFMSFVFNNLVSSLHRADTSVYAFLYTLPPFLLWFIIRVFIHTYPFFIFVARNKNSYRLLMPQLYDLNMITRITYILLFISSYLIVFNSFRRFWIFC
jgi:hypothetical protein